MKIQKLWSAAALVSTLAIAGLASSSAMESPSPAGNTLAYYCEYERSCVHQCVERAYGRHGSYCVRWDYVCRTICVGGRPYPLRPWRRGWW